MRISIYKDLTPYVVSTFVVKLAGPLPFKEFLAWRLLKILSVARVIGCIVKVIARFPERVKGVKGALKGLQHSHAVNMISCGIQCQRGRSTEFGGLLHGPRLASH